MSKTYKDHRISRKQKTSFSEERLEKAQTKRLEEFFFTQETNYIRTYAQTKRVN